MLRFVTAIITKSHGQWVISQLRHYEDNHVPKFTLTLTFLAYQLGCSSKFALKPLKLIQKQVLKLMMNSHY